MQQRMAMLDAECADKQIHRRTHRYPATPQQAVISCGLNSKVRACEEDQLKLPQCRFDRSGLRLGAHATQNFAKNEVTDQQLLLSYKLLKQCDRGIDHAA